MLYKLAKGDKYFHLQSTRKDKVIYTNSSYLRDNLHENKTIENKT